MLACNDLLTLQQPLGGLSSGDVCYRATADEPKLTTRVVGLGDLGLIWPPPQGASGGRTQKASLHGVGVGLDKQESLIPALGEAIERYCSSVYTEQQLIRASANELGKDALDLDTIPRCSKTELSHPRCPLVAPDKSVPIRWVRGISVLDGRVVYLPLVMAYLFAGFENQGERIWDPISTGCAAHRSFERALLAAICEVIERDAISIVWLQSLSLPRIEIDYVSSSLAPYWDLYQRSCKDLEYIFFDATTDIGVPTVYAVEVAPANKRVTTLVSCSTTLEPADAVAKVIRDMAQCKAAFRAPRYIPEEWDDFNDILHGGTYMAEGTRATAFEFLLQSGGKQLLTRMNSINAPHFKQALQIILSFFRRKHLDVFAVDLSTDEAVRTGMRVVRVLIPGLQPVGFRYRARYLGHSRLYQAPREMGYPVRKEGKLNHWPQPFV